MNAGSKNPIFIIIIGLVIGICVLVALYFLFTGKKKPEQAAPQPAAAQQQQKTAVPTQGAQAPANADLTQTVNKDSILRSEDSGETFEQYFTVATSGKLGMADVLSVSFHPLVKNRVIVTTYQDGLFINEDKVNLWKPIAFPPKKIYSFILDKKSPDNRVFASGVVDNNGRIFRTDNAGGNWRAVYAEPGQDTYVSALAQHPKNLSTILAGTSQGTIAKSVDGGNSWKNVGSKIDGVITNFSFDAVKTQFTYLLSLQNKIYHSNDGGSTWSDWEEDKQKEVAALYARASDASIHGDQTGAAALRAQAEAITKKNTEHHAPSSVIYIVADPSKSGIIYAGAASGLYSSSDYGKYWDKMNIIESAEKFPIKSIAINPKNSNEIVFVAGKSFYKSVNAGDTWAISPLNNNRNASFVAYDPFDPKTIFVGLSAI